MLNNDTLVIVTSDNGPWWEGSAGGLRDRTGGAGWEGPYRVPFLALVSEVATKPVVVEGEVVARPVLTVSATMDHRYLDGAHAARLARSVRGYLEDPRAFEPPLPRQPLTAGVDA